MQQAKQHTDIFGRVMGTLILLVGIAMLIGAFYTANEWFHSTPKGLEFLDAKSSTAPPPVSIGAAALEFVKQLVFLGIMITSGSILSGKGIALYLGAIHWSDPHRPTKPVAPAETHQPAPASTAAETPTPSSAAAKPRNG
jgi:hypothetical protein